MSKKSVTIKDIAKLANCTAATVSMALNNRPGISEETYRKILQIAKDLDYRPNMVARSLVSKKSKSIGLIIDNFSDHFFAHLAEGVEKLARKKGYTVFICSIESKPDLEKMSIDMLTAKGVDGIVISTVLIDSIYFAKLDKIGLPYLFINRKPYHKDYRNNVDSVVLDNFSAGYQAVDHLYKLGHDKIAFITGNLKTSSFLERTKGAQKALADNGLKLNPRMVVDCSKSYDTVSKTIAKFLRLKEPPTAVFVEEDNMAIGAREAILADGLRIPEDVALVGFDDISVSALAGIELTTMREKERSMGSIGVGMLIDKIEKKVPESTNQVVLKPELVIRKSCGYSQTGYVR